MKKSNKSFAALLLAITLVSLFAGNIFSQGRLVEHGPNNSYDMKFVMPLVLRGHENPGEDAVISVGPFDNYQVSSGAGFAETDICVNPRNPLNFIGTDNRITGFSGGRYIYYTMDGGVTWGNTSAANITANQGDPVFTADSLGNFYMAILNSGVYVWKSVNGGANWTGPTLVVSNSNADKEWIWADQTTGAFQNNVYVAYVNFATGASCDFWRSVNNGASWTGPINLGSGTPNPGPDICTNKQGKVFVFWYDGGGTSCRTSVNGGAAFSSTVTASFHNQPGTLNATSGRFSLKGNIRVNGMPHVACDVSNGAFSGNVYCTYSTNPPGPDLADVYLTRSTDGGVTFNANSPLRVNDDPAGVVEDQWMNDVSVDAAGRVWVMWWDSRNDPANILTEQWAACSTNGGVSFMPNFKVSSQNFNPNSIKIFQATEHYYLGDYQGMSGKTVTFPFYCGQNNSLNDFTAYLPDYGTSFSKSVDSVNQNGSNTNVMRIPMMGPYSGSVTYTTQVVPSPAPGTLGINFTGGNVKNLTGVPDSINMTITASATVPMTTYTVTVTGTETGGPRVHARTFNVLVGNFLGITQHGTDIPQAYQLSQNFPNPFNPSTVIYFSVPKTSEINLTVYDVLGRKVEALLNNELRNAGEYSVTFDASNLPSGVYYYKLIAGDFSDVRKMVLIK